jgi:hypothetical protein
LSPTSGDRTVHARRGNLLIVRYGNDWYVENEDPERPRTTITELEALEIASRWARHGKPRTLTDLHPTWFERNMMRGAGVDPDALGVVYVLVEDDWEDNAILGVFRSIESAQASVPGATWDDATSGHHPASGDAPMGLHIEEHEVR